MCVVFLISEHVLSIYLQVSYRVLTVRLCEACVLRMHW